MKRLIFPFIVAALLSIAGIVVLADSDLPNPLFSRAIPDCWAHTAQQVSIRYAGRLAESKQWQPESVRSQSAVAC